MTYSEFGLRTDTIKKSLFPYAILLIVLCFGILAATLIFNGPLMNAYNILYPLFWLSIPLSILQEIIFRGYGMHKLKTIFKDPATVIILNSVFFALFHLLVPERLIIAPLSFFVGLAFATVYYYYPNLFLVSLVHVIVNLMPLWLFGVK
jgi:membrane protease YdiL (CAAX protease family)